LLPSQAHRTIERLFQIPLQRSADQPGRVRILHQPCGARQRPWNAHAHRATRTEHALGLAHQRHDRIDRRRIIAARRRHAPAKALATGSVKRKDLDLGAAQVDTEPQARAGLPLALSARRHSR